MKSLKQIYFEHLQSSRFCYVQEFLITAVLGAIIKAIFNSFPYVELIGLMGTIVAFAFGAKTYGHIKNGGNNDA